MRDAVKMMKKVLATGMVLASASSVYANPFGDRDRRDPNPSISARFGIHVPGVSIGFGRGNQGRSQSFTEVEYIGQQVQAGEKVFLGKAFKLHKDHDGQEVDTIEINVQGLRRGGAAKLLVNGKKAGQVKDFDGRRAGEQTLKWTLPNKTLIVGENLKSLQVEFEGKAFVMEATLTFVEQHHRPAPRPMRPFITNVQHDFFGDGDIALAALISANYNQYQVKADKVGLQLQGSSFRASAKLCKMDQPWVCGQTKFIGFRDNLLELDAPANSQVGELVLKTGGQFSISQVVVFPARR